MQGALDETFAAASVQMDPWSAGHFQRAGVRNWEAIGYRAELRVPIGSRHE